MARAGVEIIRKEVASEKSKSFSPIGRPGSVIIAPARASRFKIKLYIDELEISVFLGILIRLPLYLIDVIKEEWFWWTKLYKYEIGAPLDWGKERDKALAESRRRIKKYKT